MEIGVVKDYDPCKQTGVIASGGKEYSFHRRRLRRIVPSNTPPHFEPTFIGAHKSRGLRRPSPGDKVAFETSRRADGTIHMAFWGYLWDLQAAVHVATLVAPTFTRENLERLAEKITAQAGA